MQNMPLNGRLGNTSDEVYEKALVDSHDKITAAWRRAYELWIAIWDSSLCSGISSLEACCISYY